MVEIKAEVYISSSNNHHSIHQWLHVQTAAKASPSTNLKSSVLTSNLLRETADHVSTERWYGGISLINKKVDQSLAIEKVGGVWTL